VTLKRPKKILVIDDEASIRRLLKVSLEGQGYQVEESCSGKDGIQAVIETKPDVVILDLGLPDMDGFQIIKTVRDWSKVPIIVLTVRDDDASKVAILDAGANDYITKPFSVPELLARLRVAERHVREQESQTHIFQSGVLEVDLAGRIVKVNGIEIHLTLTEYGILRLLIKNAGKVVTHRQILKEVWGPNALEHTQYIRVYVGHLRKKLEPAEGAVKLIATEPGVGYRLLVS
jgi:two-component system, OmpR family, KDP operon response regulator KdpE